MGLLNDPQDRKKLSSLIVEHHRKAIIVSFFIGIAWFLALASEHLNNRTYFSENALLPGLVVRDFNSGSSLQRLLESLRNEARSSTSIPHAWIQAQFRQIGLDVYTHNFTLRYPFDPKSEYKGTNMYAVMRAPKAPSTEALVMAAPFRGPESIHATTFPSIALMIELARYFRQYFYWSKDIIFLIVEHENLGFQAWLNAYHNVPISDFLDTGSLSGRSGPIQGVVNLQISDEQFESVDIKIEGLNGQLPNLDLFNLAVELCSREMVMATFHSQDLSASVFPLEVWQDSVKTMISMVAMQSTGLPTGGHGLFHRFGIQAISLFSETRRESSSKVRLVQLGRVLEGIFRSLNNLLEKFHQSFFFYLLSSPRQYISIGLYMPPFALICLPVLIKALYLYIDTKFVYVKKKDLLVQDNFSMWSALDLIILSHLFGFIIYSCPSFLDILSVFKFSAEDSLYSLLVTVLTVFTFVTYAYSQKKTLTQREYSIKLCVILLELGAFLYTLSLINISLAVVLSMIYIPISVSLGFKSRLRKILSFLVVFAHPFIFTFICVFVQSCLTLSSAMWYEHFWYALTGHKKIVLYTVEDMYFFSNWNYKIATLAVFPLWLELWMLSTMKCS